jgi:mannose-1-phosphate guanylyltransferase
VPLLNQPFLAWQLALLRQHGVTDVILSCSYRVDDVRAALGDGSALGTRLRYVVEDEPLGTGGGVRNAADLARGTVFVLNGDVLTDADLSAMRAFHEASRSRTTIALTAVENPRAYGLVETDHAGRLLRFREKPGADEPLTTNMINAGIYLIDAALLDRIPTGRAVSIEREFFPALIADGIPSHGWHLSGYWRDIGSPAAYLAAQIDLLEGRVRTAPAPGGDHDGIAASATLDRTRLVGPNVIGERARISPTACIGPCAVLGPGVIVADDARIERSVLWERVEVGDGAALTGVVVGAEARIGARARLGSGAVIESGAIVPPDARVGGP